MNKFAAKLIFETTANEIEISLDRLLELVPVLLIDNVSRSITKRNIDVAIGHVRAALEGVLDEMDDSPPSSGIGF